MRRLAIVSWERASVSERAASLRSNRHGPRGGTRGAQQHLTGQLARRRLVVGDVPDAPEPNTRAVPDSRLPPSLVSTGGDMVYEYVYASCSLYNPVSYRAVPFSSLLKV